MCHGPLATIEDTMAAVTLPPADDTARFALLKSRLFTAVVGDVLDQMGLQRQFLPPGLAPLKPDQKIAGRAMPVLEADVFDDAGTGFGPLAAKRFGLLFEALDNLMPNEVYVAHTPIPRYALWGGLMTTRALHLKAAGAVIDGFVRDASEIEAMSLPVFARGLYAQDQGPRGKVIDYRCTIEIGGVRIAPGDLIYGDREGVLVIPRAVEDEAIRRALEKADTENAVAIAIRNGMSTVDAFANFGVM
jgi:4-hydroxy-4-methyl-2-oxoglutarate aldolase